MYATLMLFQIVFSRKCHRTFVTFKDAFIGVQSQMASQRIFTKRTIANWTWNFVAFRNVPFVQHFVKNAFCFGWSSAEDIGFFFNFKWNWCHRWTGRKITNRNSHCLHPQYVVVVLFIFSEYSSSVALSSISVIVNEVSSNTSILLSSTYALLGPGVGHSYDEISAGVNGCTSKCDVAIAIGNSSSCCCG